MGMTIDEHIGVIEDLKSTMSVCMPEPEKTEIYTSLGEAIETMRKYQKIVRIVSLNDEEFKQCGLRELKEILEVIADGNDDNKI